MSFDFGLDDLLKEIKAKNASAPKTNNELTIKSNLVMKSSIPNKSPEIKQTPLEIPEVFRIEATIPIDS
jgi:hypothetical protein